MLSHQSRFLLVISLMLLTGCSEEIEQRLAPDPQLQEQQNDSTNPSATSETETESQSSSNSKDETNTEELAVSTDVPDIIPFYPNSEIVNQNIQPDRQSGEMELISNDRRNSIIEFYQQELNNDSWEIKTPSVETDTNTDQQRIIAESDQLKLTIFVASGDDSNSNRIRIRYQPLASSTTETATDSFSDLDKTPDSLETYVRDVAKLGVLSAIEPESKQFSPNAEITRRTFARWLFQAHNRFYPDRPSQQIRSVEQAETPAFQDISPNDPDFKIIQGLAEAGIIPSRLTDDATITRFRPDAPLKRETLLLWKIPLDTRRNLPEADVKTVQETWGFQDASQIDSKAFGAVVADFSQGERSIIRRLYGYTQLLQPNKPVTRAQAAAALWSFGTQGDIITAKELTDD